MYLKIIVLLIICSGSVRIVFGQDVAMHTQGIMQQEFLNPAYNSFKDYVSLSFYNRAQWGSDYQYSPESYVTNLYLPFARNGLGVNIGVVYEDVGLRTTTELKAGLCHNIRFSKYNYFAFGFGVGFLQNSFNRDKIISYPDEDLSFLLDQTDLNTLYPAASVGALFISKYWFAGLSSMTSSIQSNSDNSQYFPGFDFSAGGIFRLSPWIQMRPGFILKYYNEKGVKSENGTVTDHYTIPPIYDVSVNFLLGGKVWLGTSHRFNQAQTFSVDLKLGAMLKLGYTFEAGIGDGLNQYNSHGFRLSYLIRQKKGIRKESLDVWTGKYLIENMASFIY